MRPLRSVSLVLRRWLLLTLLVGLMGAALLIAYLSLRGVADDLTQTRAQLEQAVELAESGDVAAAAERFGAAEVVSGQAIDRVHSPTVRLVGFLPRVDVTVDSVIASTEAAHLISRAGGTIMSAVADVPGGLDALTLGGGGQSGWLEAATSLQAPLADANAMLMLARDLVASAPPKTTSAQVDQARITLLDELNAVLPTVDDVTTLVGVLPDLLGAGTERRYFLGAQNPAELRGTGGLIGAYAILTARDGQVSISSFSPVQDLPQDLFDEDSAPSSEFFDRYELVIAGLGTWLNVNFSPNFPMVAETIESMYREATGERLDGSIVVDPFALESLLGATGPVDVPDPEIGILSAESVVSYIVNEAPLALGLGGERKEILGEASRAVLDEFLSGDVQGRHRIEALADAVSGGHLVVHSASPDVQSALSRLDATGALPDPAQTILAVAINNTALSKADFWLQQRIHWEVTLDPDGTASATAVVQIENAAPADPGIPRYIIGPGVPDLTFGESWPFVTLLCGTCEILSVQYDDEDGFGAPSGMENGHTVVDVRTRVPLGDTATIEYTLELPNAWRRSGTGGAIDLQVWTPPQINPADVSVEVRAPSGWTWSPVEDEVARVEGSTLYVDDPAVRQVLGPYALGTAP